VLSDGDLGRLAPVLAACHDAVERRLQALLAPRLIEYAQFCAITQRLRLARSPRLVFPPSTSTTGSEPT
jgi:hypothetical protein